MSKHNYVITEGEFDLRLMTLLLPNDYLLETKLIASGGYSSALSLTKTLLTTSPSKDNNYFLILDADSYDRKKIDEKRQFILDYVGNSESVHVYLFRPQIETILFSSIKFVKEMVNKEISEVEIERAKFEPDLFFQKYGIKKMDILGMITQNYIEELRSLPEFKEMFEIMAPPQAA